jgi:hypothetical protein
MEKLNRLVWAAGLSFTTFGVRIGVRVSAEHLLEPLVSHLPVGWKAESSWTVERLYSVIRGSVGPRSWVRPFSFLYCDAQQLARSLHPKDLYDALEADMDFYLAQTARQKLFVHAGVVAWRGQAIVIPGRSQSGKTTLVKAFLQAGASYYSDEYAVFDGRGRVYPFPRPLSIRGDSNETNRLSAESLGSRTGTEPIPVALIALTSYKAGARWNPKGLSPGRGTLGLLANTLAARKQPQRALATLVRAARHVPVLAGSRGEASETVASILQVMGDQDSLLLSATSDLLFATRRNRK